MKVGLVLGAGGVLGGAWLTGGLHALARETDWDPGSADFVVGTSAGSMVGTLVAAGVPPWFMVAHSRGESFSGLVGADGRPGFRGRPRRPAPCSGSIAGCRGSGRARCGWWPRRSRTRSGTRRSSMMAGWLPAGLVSTDSLKEIVRRVAPDRWIEHPNLWTVACDYGTGKRVPFGRADAPTADVADAVAASCAIPGFYRPGEDRQPPLRGRRASAPPRTSTCSPAAASTS